jgi:hypothetical protein
MRCQRLNRDGRRCKKEAKFFITFHVPIEHYPEKVSWGIVYMCKEHSEGKKYKINNSDYPIEGEELGK